VGVEIKEKPSGKALETAIILIERTAHFIEDLQNALAEGFITVEEFDKMCWGVISLLRKVLNKTKEV